MATRTTTRAATAKRAKPPASTSLRRRPRPDVIARLKADHREVERLFAAFEKLGPTAYPSKRKLVDQMVAQLSQHAVVEEAVLYPAAREEVPSSTDDVLRIWKSTM